MFSVFLELAYLLVYSQNHPSDYSLSQITPIRFSKAQLNAVLKSCSLTHLVSSPVFLTKISYAFITSTLLYVLTLQTAWYNEG